MNQFNGKSNRVNGSDLERVVEPLASYICATDRPKAALKQALAVLLSQVEQTNRAADAGIAALLERQLVMPA